MSDDRSRDDDGDDRDDRSEEEEKGLGLTDEFQRLESEIEREKKEGPREVRSDETDSSEFVAPVQPRHDLGGETDDWAAPETLGDIHDDSEPEPAPAGDPDDSEPEPEADGEPEESEPQVSAPEEGESEEIEPEAAEARSADPSGDDSDSTPAADSDEGVHGGVPDAPAKAPEPVAASTEEPATEHTVVRNSPLAARPIAAGDGDSGGGDGYGLPIYDEDIEDKTPALWWRFMAASVMIVVAVATSVSLTSLLAFNDVLKGFQHVPGVGDNDLPAVEPGDPFTMLIVGSDKRTNTPGDPGRSDTTMLLRVDAQDEVLSLFSLPRDLKVDIPGYGTAKLNEAYTDGGIKKTLETVQGLTGLDVNYVVNVDFQGFADAVDAINCVYVDVDRKYFNDNSTAVSSEEQFAAIDINAGYQRLCGLNALDYVRYRHTDSDFVRSARQQDFLRNARAQVPVREVLPIIGGDEGSDLLNIFTKYTATTIRTPAQLIDMLRSFVAVSDVAVKEVHFNGSDSLENGISYVTANQGSIDKAVQDFLGEKDSSGGPDAGSKKPDKNKDKSGGGKNKPDKTSNANVISTADSAAQYCADYGGVDKVEAFGRTSARRLKFPVYVPTVQVPGSCYDTGSRQYDIKDTDDNKQAAYKLVFNLNSSTAAGEYYGVEGTEWGSPPILEKKSETITMGDRDYDLYYDGDRLRLVAFRVGDASYWVSNTLLQTLSDGQMLAIAKSMTEAQGG